jgi:multiple sugar transport system permease protein
MIRLAVLLWSLGPLFWQLVTSLRPPAALVSGGPGSAAGGSALHAGWTLVNYAQLLQADPPFWRYLLNSAVVGGAGTALTLLLAVPCAYGLQQQSGAIRWSSLTLLLGASLFPTALLFLALLEWARQLGLANHLLALALPYAALSLPLAILLLRAALADLPPELEDAALLEGMGALQRLRFVLLPLLAPAIASTAILVFLFSWSEYPIALTWISRESLLTLSPAIARIGASSVFTVPYGAFAAATVLGSLPLVLLLLLFQRAIVSGLTQGAVKG